MALNQNPYRDRSPGQPNPGRASTSARRNTPDQSHAHTTTLGIQDIRELIIDNARVIFHDKLVDAMQHSKQQNHPMQLQLQQNTQPMQQTQQLQHNIQQVQYSILQVLHDIHHADSKSTSPADVLLINVAAVLGQDPGVITGYQASLKLRHPKGFEKLMEERPTLLEFKSTGRDNVEVTMHRTKQEAIAITLEALFDSTGKIVGICNGMSKVEAAKTIPDLNIQLQYHGLAPN